jgi:hypothetical protein
MSVVSVRIDNAMLGEIEALREHVQELADVDRAEFIRRGVAAAIEVAKLDVGQCEKSAAALSDMVREALAHGDYEKSLLQTLPKLLTPLYVTAALDTMVQTVLRGPHAGDVARAYGESFREFLLELSNSELEGDVLVVRVGGEEKRVKVGDYVDRVVEEVRSYVNLMNKRRSRK